MPTPILRWPDLSGSSTPDVPYEVGRLARAIEADVQKSRTDQAQGDSATLAAANAYTDSSKWQRRSLAANEDLDTLKEPGLYAVTTGAIASSLVNAPPGFSNPGSVEVTPASSVNGVWQQTARVYWTKDTTRVFIRQSLSGSFTGAWEPVKSVMGTALSRTNWDTITMPGTYSVDSLSAAATMTNLPPTPSGFAGTVEVLPITSTRVSQRATEYGTGSPGTVWTRTQAVGGAFPAWGRLGWDSVPLAASQDLNALTTPGRYRANTGAIAGTILNRPAGISQPFTVDVSLLSSSNGIYAQEVTGWSASGPLRAARVSLSGVFGEWIDPAKGAPTPAASRTQVTAFGDSLTAGGDAGGPWPTGASWPEKLAGHLPGVTVTNRGRSGDSSDEILIRAGALTPLFAVSGETIPASGSVGLTTGQVISIRDGRGIAGSIAGVSGTLRHDGNGAWTFTRSEAGAAVSAPGKQQAFVTAAGGAAGHTLVYWAGRNDISMPGTILEPSQAEHLAANAARFMEWAAPQRKQVMIIGPTTGTHEPAGSPGHAAVTEANRRLRELFPANYADAQSYLVNEALKDMGVTPTDADVAAKAAGEMPPSLIAVGDTVHFTQAAAENLARNFVAPFLRGRGWV